MLIPNKHSGYSKDGIRLYPIDSGGSSGPTNSTTQTSNIPEYARPYVETMLGSAQNELFNYKDTVDPITGETVKTPTDLKGYRAFGGSYDAAGKQTGYDVDKYFGGFQPLQEQAMGAARGLAPTQQTGDASTMAGQAGIQALNASYNPMTAGYQSFGGEQAGQYMSPYLEASLNPQIAAAQRQSQMAGQEQQAQAVSRGAFGGSRDAIMRAERERNLGSQVEGIRSKGYQDAFNNAQTQFNQDQARAMAAQQANIGQQQFGANLGMQGLSQANQAAQTLGTLGQQQYGQQLGAIETQNKLGTQQQQFEQAKIDQQIKDYANQQQFSMQQLGNMSNLLRGLPMQSTTTQTYQAAPSGVSQIAGLGTSAAAAYGLSGAGKAKGGVIKKTKKSGLDHLGMYNAMKK
jgi:hypothetical protein